MTARPGAPVRVASALRAGRLIPKRLRGLRAGAVVLKPQGVMAWHSTQEREELLIVLMGAVTLDIQVNGRRAARQVKLRAGQCAWLQSRTRHCVRNASAREARYVYVTGPAS